MVEYLEKMIELQNPCGIEDYRPEHKQELIEETKCKYLKDCKSRNPKFDLCINQYAWMLSKDVAAGSLIELEKEELEKDFKRQLYTGTKILDNNTGRTILIENNTIDSLISNIMIRTNIYLEKARPQ